MRRGNVAIDVVLHPNEHVAAAMNASLAERIVEEVERLLGDPVALRTMSRRSFPYGDGRAAGRIAAVIGDWLGRSGSAERRSVAW